MKDLFPGYFPKTGTELEALWKSDETLFVFDTNILLGLYRYTPTTKDAFLNTLDKIKERVWLPYQIAEEYLRNRASVIHEEADSYSTLLKQIEGVRTSLNNQRKNPFITDETLTQANTLFDQLKTELDEGKKAFTERYHHDSILEQISALFDGKVGQNYEKTQIEAVITEGTERYECKVPPGFEDQDKLDRAKTSKEKVDALGDYVLWRQIIEHAKAQEKNVVLVTDDVKQDWWSKTKNIDRTFGPRSELILEFRAAVLERDVYICQSNKFLQLSNEYLDTEIEEDVISEVKSYKSDEVGDMLQNKTRDIFKPRFIDLNGMSKNDADFLEDLEDDTRYKELKEQLHIIKNLIKELRLERFEVKRKLEKAFLIPEQRRALNKKLNSIEKNLMLEMEQSSAIQKEISSTEAQLYQVWDGYDPFDD